MIQILYTADHTERAISLTMITPGARHSLVSSLPIKIPGLETLVFWGHGTSTSLCDLVPSELVKLIVRWKKLNPSLKTVELITCNARHSSGSDPLANKVKSGLRSGILQGTTNMAVKALPVSVSGKHNAWSILLAEPNFKSWAYITAPGVDDALMMHAQKLVSFDVGPKGGSVSFKGDIAQKADKVARENPVRQWTMNYGYFNTLRSNLVVVR